MAQLTWRELSAPDFSSSLRGTELFANLLNRAASGLEAGVNAFDQSRTDRVNNDLALRIAGASDSEAAKALAASLATDPNARRITAQTAAIAASRPSQLIQQAAQEQALSDAKYTSDQVRLTDSRAPQLMQARSFLQNDDMAGYKKFMEANPDLYKGLGFKTINDFTSSLQDDLKGAVGIAGQRLDQQIARNSESRNQTLFQNGQDDRQVGIKADEYFTQIQSMIDPNNPDTIRNAMFNGDLANAPGRVRAAVFNKISQLYPGVVTPGQVGLTSADFGSGAAGGGQSRVMGWTPRGVDGNSNASVDNKIALISKGLGGVDPDTPLSLNQFLSQDMTALEGKPAGRNNFGNMRNTDGSWKQFNSRAEYDQAQRAWLQRRWNEGARTIRDAVEGRVVGGSASSSASLAAGARQRLGQDRIGAVRNSTLLDAADGPTTARGAADQLRGTEAWKGVNYSFLTSRLQQIVGSSKVNGKPTVTFGQAAQILDGALNDPSKLGAYAAERDGSGGLFRIYSASNPFNEQFIQNEVNRIKRGGLVQGTARETDVGSSIQVLAAAQQRAAAAAANLERVRRMAPYNPNLRAQIPALMAELDAANAAVTAAGRGAERVGSPTQQPIARTIGGRSDGRPQGAVGSGILGSIADFIGLRSGS